jgi:hypothetical protein
VLENTFAGISEMADQLFPFIRPIKHLILKIFWPSRERLERCCPVPILFLSGRQDEIVPCGQMDQLLAAAKIGATKGLSSSGAQSWPFSLEIVLFCCVISLITLFSFSPDLPRAAASEFPAGAAQFPQPTHQMVQIPDGSHNDTWLKGALVYFPALQAFMVEQMRTRGPLIRSFQSAASE